jgi:hypothetical protein
MTESMESILSFVKNSIESPAGNDTLNTLNSDQTLRIEQEKTKQLQLQLELHKLKHPQPSSHT